MNMIKRIHLLALTVTFSLAALPAVAQDVKEPQSLGSVEVGGQNGTGIDQSSKLQQYETVFKGIALLGANLNWKSSSNYFVKLDTTKLGLDDQYAALNVGRSRKWNFGFFLTQNPRWFSNTAETLYAQGSPGVFTLPDAMRSSLQRIWSPASTDPKAPTDSNNPLFWSLRDYVNGAQAVDLSYLRKTGGVNFDLTAFENWTFKASYQRENRDGTQPVSFTAGPGIDEIANPVQYTTQDARAEAEYFRKGFFLNAAFTHSLFTNDVPYTTVDNPIRLTNTDFFWTATTVNTTNANAAARLWNAPDNRANSFDLTAGAPLPAHHKATFTASVTSMKMDRTLIPQATNPLLNLATTSADYGKFSLVPEYNAINGDMGQTLFMGNFSGDPSPKFGYSAFYRAFDLTDNKPTYTFHSTVNSDGGASYSATGITTGNAGYNSGQFKFEAHVAPVRGIRLGINAGRVKTAFEERDVLDISDRTIGFTFDAASAWVGFHGGYTNLKRTPGAVNASFDSTALDPNAGMKDVSAQDGKLFNAALTLTPLDKAAITFSTQVNNSDFPATTIGLKKSDMKNYGVDIVYALHPLVTVNAGYIYENYQMNTNLWYSANGSETRAATNVADQYFNAITDKVDTYSAGIRLTRMRGRFDFTSNYMYSKGRSDSGFTITPGGLAGGDLMFPTSASANFTPNQYLNYPEVFNASTIWKNTFNYHLTGNIAVAFLYWHQKFDAANWATDNLWLYMQRGSALYASTPGAVGTFYPQLDPAANRALVLGATVPNFKANIYRVSLNYRF